MAKALSPTDEILKLLLDGVEGKVDYLDYPFALEFWFESDGGGGERLEIENEPLFHYLNDELTGIVDKRDMDNLDDFRKFLKVVYMKSKKLA